MVWIPAVALAVAAFAPIIQAIQMNATWISGSALSHIDRVHAASAIPAARSGHCAATDGLQMSIMGGDIKSSLANDVWKLDLTTYIWTPISTNSPPSIRKNHACLYMGSAMYLFGGFDGSAYNNDLWTFALQATTTGHWTLTNPQLGAPVNRSEHSMASHPTQQVFYIFGGCNIQSSKGLNDLILYDVSATNWTNLTLATSCPGPKSQPVCRVFTSLVATQNTLYLHGGISVPGQSSSIPTLDDFWTYDISQKFWTDITAVDSAPTNIFNSFIIGKEARIRHTMAVINGSIFVFAGQRGTDDSTNDARIYDIASRQWAVFSNSVNVNGAYGTIGQSSTFNISVPKREHSMVQVNSTVMFTFGGYSTYGNTGFLNDTWRFDISLDNYTTIASSKTYLTTATTYSSATTTAALTTGTASNTIASSFSASQFTVDGSSYTSTPISGGASATTSTPLFTQCSFTLSVISTSTLISADTTSIPPTIISTAPPQATVKSKDNPALMIQNPLIFAAVGIVFTAFIILMISYAWNTRGKNKSEAKRYKERQSEDPMFEEFSAVDDLPNQLGSDDVYSSRDAIPLPPVSASVKMSRGARLKTPNGTIPTIRTMTEFKTLMANGNTEIALPGFMQLTVNVDFVMEKLLVQNGDREIYLGKIVNPALKIRGRVIIKRIAAGRTNASLHQSRIFDQELAIMYYLGRHANIAELLGWSDDPLVMIMKFYENGSLDTFINSGGIRNKDMLVSFAQDICEGIAFMHERAMVHCDLKPGNVLIDKSKNGQLFCVLTDFGITQIFTMAVMLVPAFEVVSNRGFSMRYAAPEILNAYIRRLPMYDKQTGFKGDIYALGLTIYEMITRIMPWDVVPTKPYAIRSAPFVA